MGWIFWLSVLFIIYTYIGYPLILALLARFRKPQQAWVPGQPSVTLLIAAYNEQGVIARKLKNCLELDYPRDSLQILVAADGSDDGTADIVHTYADQGVELAHSPERLGKMAAINRAVGRAQGEIVVFSDANNLYAPDALQKLVAPFCDPQVGAVSGAKTIIQTGDGLSGSEGLYWKYESQIKKNETRLGSTSGAVGEIFAIRRRLYKAPPYEGIINDDFFLAMAVLKQNFRVVYAPDARSYEHVSATNQDEITRRLRIIAGRFQAMAMAPSLLPWHNPVLIWQVFSHKFFRPLVPLAMITALLANIAAVSGPAGRVPGSWLALGYPYNWLFMALQSIFYGLGWLGNHVTLTGKLGKLLFLPTFLLNSNIAALAGLFHYLGGNHTASWKRVRRREEIIDK